MLIKIQKLREKVYRLAIKIYRKATRNNPYGEIENTIFCIKCGEQLNETELDIKSTITCKKCESEYSIQDHSSFANAQTYAKIYYKWDCDVIRRVHFNNPPYERLEMVSSHILKLNEKRPKILLPIVKEYYDAVIELLQEFLTRPEIENLSEEDVNRIMHNPPEKMVKLSNLFEFLLKAYPDKKEKMEEFRSENIKLLKRMTWVRNKKEHVSSKCWTIPGRIYDDNSKSPDSSDPPDEILDYAFVKKCNHVVVELFKLVRSLDAKYEEMDPIYQMEGSYNIESFRMVD